MVFEMLFFRLFQIYLIVLFATIILAVNPSLTIAGELNLQWHGDQGYQVEAEIIYPDLNPGKMVEVAGMQAPKNLTMLKVKIRNAKGKELVSYDNVSDGQLENNDFLQFHFDPVGKELRGWLDIGGVGKNDYFLKGQPGFNLDLFHLDNEGKESKVDHNNGDINFSAL